MAIYDGSSSRKHELGKSTQTYEGNTIYERTPYWFKETYRAFIKRAATEPLDYFPVWSGEIFGKPNVVNRRWHNKNGELECISRTVRVRLRIVP
jgi:hypothetical protein